MNGYRVVYNKKQIMLKAHRLFRDGRYGTFAECLVKAWHDAKTFKYFAEGVGEEVHTWYGWTLLGREVIHNEHCVGQIELYEPLKRGISKIFSYFTFGQTCELGTQPPKEELV